MPLGTIRRSNALDPFKKHRVFKVSLIRDALHIFIRFLFSSIQFYNVNLLLYEQC